MKKPTAEIQRIVERVHQLTPPVDYRAIRSSFLIDVGALCPELIVDLKYATEDNFMGFQMYDGSHAVLQEPVANALLDVQNELNHNDMGLIIYDAYRPWWVTRLFWDASPHEFRTFLADPATGSRHNRGCAVDVGLIRLSDGGVLPMPSGFDEFTERAHVTYDGGSDESRRNRDLLIAAMSRNDFSVYSAEWWHFEHITWPEYPILNEPVP